MSLEDKIILFEQGKVNQQTKSKQELVDYATGVFEEWLELAREGKIRAIAVVVDTIDGTTQVGYPEAFEPAMIGALAYLQKRLLEQ